MEKTPEELKEELERLKSELESEKAKKQKPIYIQISRKGCVSVYGIRRFPVSFYADEWQKILALKNDILEYISENFDKLAHKQSVVLASEKDEDENELD